VLKDFDKDGDKKLDLAERSSAREFLAREAASGGGPRRRGPGAMGGPGGPGGGRRVHSEPTKPGQRVSPSDVPSHAGKPLYDTGVLRTWFLTFESPDWEKELEAFHDTDVEVPARLMVDGKTYEDVGVRFRGMSSYGMVGPGQKRSLNLSLDAFKEGQAIDGFRTLNLLNSHEDPSFLRAVLYCEVARQHVPAPRANLVRVVINGESWGIYANVEQFNKDFVQLHFKTAKAARWKVPGSPNGKGGLEFLGDDPAPYKKIYDLKSKEDPIAWSDLIRLCKVLNQTPADQLEKALEPILDVEGALRFLALENALINNDGYWVRASDYLICQDAQGRFHVLPGDTNETFTRAGRPGGPGGRRRPGGGPGGPDGPGGPGGPGGGRGGGGGSVELDPLVAAQDASKPLLSRLLAVPSLRERYLAMVRQIADKHLDWKTLGPVAQRYHELIAADVRADTRKLESTEAFEGSLTQDHAGTGHGPMGGGSIGLKNFADQRRAYLLGRIPAGR
jgi:spore coat protein CotH